jgi:hypothetical protein
MQESALSGTLNLGHYGVSQSTGFEAVNVDTSGAELITPFAKLQVPYKVRMSLDALDITSTKGLASPLV